MKDRGERKGQLPPESSSSTRCGGRCSGVSSLLTNGSDKGAHSGCTARPISSTFSLSLPLPSSFERFHCVVLLGNHGLLLIKIHAKADCRRRHRRWPSGTAVHLWSSLRIHLGTCLFSRHVDRWFVDSAERIRAN